VHGARPRFTVLVPGKRMGRLNDKCEWVVEEVPELRIIEDELWHAVKERQKVVRETLLARDFGIRAERARRQATCFRHCFSAASAVVAFLNARNRGTCKNMLTIRRDVFTASVLAGLKDSLMDPALVREFAAEYHRKLNRLNTARD
jgi:site-specific DNA recombinase